MPSTLKALLTLVLLTFTSVGQAVPASYVEALRCLDSYRDPFGPEAAGTLCRGAQSANVTAISQCVDLASDRDLPLPAVAEVCQGSQYATLTATMNCLDQALEMVEPMAAARLCQRASYRVYTSRFNCVSAAVDMVDTNAAAEVCGGIE